MVHRRVLICVTDAFSGFTNLRKHVVVLIPLPSSGCRSNERGFIYIPYFSWYLQPDIVETVTLSIVMLNLTFDYGKHFFYSDCSYLCTGNHRVLSSISLDSPGTMYMRNSTIYIRNICIQLMISTEVLSSSWDGFQTMKWMGKILQVFFVLFHFFLFIYSIDDVYNILYMVYYMPYIMFWTHMQIGHYSICFGRSTAN